MAVSDSTSLSGKKATQTYSSQVHKLVAMKTASACAAPSGGQHIKSMIGGWGKEEHANSTSHMQKL